MALFWWDRRVQGLVLSGRMGLGAKVLGFPLHVVGCLLMLVSGLGVSRRGNGSFSTSGDLKQGCLKDMRT